MTFVLVFSSDMFLRLLLFINLFGFIITLTIRDYSSRYKKLTDHFPLLNKDTQNIFGNNKQPSMKWHDILFISILIFVFLVLLICLHYQRSLVNFIFTLFTKRQNNNGDTDEHVTVLHQTSPSTNVKSMYLTVPQPSHLQH